MNKTTENKEREGRKSIDYSCFSASYIETTNVYQTKHQEFVVSMEDIVSKKKVSQKIDLGHCVRENRMREQDHSN